MNVDSVVLSLVLAILMLMISVHNNIFRRRNKNTYTFLERSINGGIFDDNPDLLKVKTSVNETLLPAIKRNIQLSLDCIIPISIIFAAVCINMILSINNISYVLLQIISSAGFAGCLIITLMLYKQYKTTEKIVISITSIVLLSKIVSLLTQSVTDKGASQ